MSSIAEGFEKDLEKRGELVKLANGKTGWFAVYPSKWQSRIEDARRDGRDGPNLVVYKTNSIDKRDHYVIPFAVIRNLLINETLTISTKKHATRWNLTLLNGRLHVSHRSGMIDVSLYHGARLIVEQENEHAGNDIPEEVDKDDKFHEGAVQKILINKYERNTEAREKCIAHYGKRCIVCQSRSFAQLYSPEVAHIIHVHHLTPLSEIGEEYEVDPIKDLRPVCPNCHAVIHSRKPALTMDEIAHLLKSL